MAKIITTFFFIVTGSAVFGQTLAEFSYSDCLKDRLCASSEVKEIRTVGLATTISLRTYAPCNGNLEGGLETTDNILNLKFRTIPTIIKDKKGKQTKILEIADCNCMFDFIYQITGLATADIKQIRVNGLSLKDIDSKNMVSEIKLERD